MPWIEVDQSQPEWLKMRVGCVTASRMFDICDRLKVNAKSGKKGDYKQSRRNYMIEKICERLTGLSMDHYVSPWMQRGMAEEPAALMAYQEQTGALVLPGGFFLHDSIEYFGASPDGLIGEVGLLELKNLKPENHYAFLRGAPIPDEYIWQCNAQLACAPEREFVDYGSHCGDMLSPQLRIFARRHYRDKERIKQVEEEVLKFNEELAAELMELTKAEPVNIAGIAQDRTQRASGEVAAYSGIVP